MDILDLEDDFGPNGFQPETKGAHQAYAKTEQFPCEQCGGSGFYRGHRVHQSKTHCFACRGKGYFLTSLNDRRKAATQRRAKVAQTKAEVLAAIKADHPGVLEFLTKAMEWSEFAGSLHAAAHNGKALSEKQLAAAYSMMAKQAARAEARAAEQKKSQVEVDLAPIRVMFEAAVAAGHKAPKYRAEGLIISRAASYGRNPGALYVKNADDLYLGKITGTVFSPTREGVETHKALAVIAQNPLAAAIAYGRRTGKCACCGRELTKGESIDRGIGPICAEKWGLL